MTNRAAVVAFYPPGVAQSYREGIRHRFETEVRSAHIANQIQTFQGRSFILADLTTSVSRHALEKFTSDFVQNLVGADKEMWHPDFTWPILLMGAEEPLPKLRAAPPARYSYKELELRARDFEDSLKHLCSVWMVTKIGIVQESVYLLFSEANVAGYGLTPDSVIKAIAARNAVIPGGTMHTEGHNFPVQLSAEFHTADQTLAPFWALTPDTA